MEVPVDVVNESAGAVLQPARQQLVNTFGGAPAAKGQLTEQKATYQNKQLESVN